MYSISELAALVGVNDSTWKMHVTQGCPVPKSARDLRPWLKRYHPWRRANGKVAATEMRSTARVREDEAEAKAEKEQWRAKLTKLDYQVRTGDLVSRTDVLEFAGSAVDVVRQRLNDMVQKMASRLVGQVEHVIAAELQSEVDSMCSAFERGMSKTTQVGDDE